jgi:hypothetical protein
MTISENEQLSIALVSALAQGRGMNQLLHRVLEAVRSGFSADRIVLYDYHEFSGTFDLLYFCGYPPDSRSNLRKRMPGLRLHKALDQSEPYWADAAQEQLLVPLYFQDILEAVLLMESFHPRLAPDDARWARFNMVSRFLGLLMSSNRLPVNAKARPVSTLDLERAREVQLKFLPADNPVTDGYEIVGFNRASTLVGGDYYDYFTRRENQIQCVIADACGHGMAAALIMSTFRGLLLSEMDELPSLESLFTRLNAHLYAGGDLVQYLTTVFVEYHEQQRRLNYLNAGHFDPLIIHADGSATSLPGGGPPLGMFQGSTYSSGTFAVRSGDLLVLFTDGLVELRNAQDEFFGVEGITSAIVKRLHLPLHELGREVMLEAENFSRSPSPDDDLTLFLIRLK